VNDRQRVELQEGFVLSRKPYRETSLLIELLSRDYGRVGLVAKGARGKRAKWAGLLQPFNLLSLSWTGRSDLQTLTGVEWLGPVLQLDATRLYCGLYLNELVSRFLHRHDPHPHLFLSYAESLKALAAAANIERTLRLFETTLLNEVGYGLQLEYEAEGGKNIEPDKHYTYLPEQGPVEAAVSKETISGTTLIGLRQKNLEHDDVLLEAKRLLRLLIAHHLGGKPLQSRAFFTSKRQYTHESARG
jgi:DNA repair protein RecO (recombination protein O)